MSQVQIRPADPGDAPLLADLLDRAFGPYADLPGLPDMAEDLDRDIARGRALVADRDGARAGLAVLACHGATAHLMVLAVDPARGGHGIGSALVAACETRATAAGCRRMDLATHAGMPDALRFYTRRGWRVIERTGLKTILSKPLGPLSTADGGA
ncbi:GNAT family N-acetyltransferase [Rhodobacteraceae bacterium CCMM004]|nr:GNAT family N-acetyltransferase [Rhodobacteraceae bacterium CCMM004]